MLSISISLAALITSVLSPFLTEFLKNRHELKMYRLRFYSEHKAAVIERYVKATGEMIQFATPETCQSFGAAHGEMILYVDDDARLEMQKIYDMFVYNNHSSVSSAPQIFDSICAKLAEQYPRIKS